MLTFVDRSRWEKYWQHCARACWWQYYAGATQHGVRQKAESLPLATGLSLHDIFAAILKGQDVRMAIREGLERYGAMITARGFDLAARVVPSGLSADDAWAMGIPAEDDEAARQREILYTIREQQTLIEGLAWVFALYVLPTILAECEVIDVEREEGFVLPGTCTCGLSEAITDWHAHQARGCDGIYVMARPDLVLRRRSTGQLEYHEFKTAAQVTKDTKDQWEHRPQFLIGCRAVEQRLGEPVTAAYVHHFIKGSRKAEYDSGSGDYTGPKRQQSMLCYLYHREPVPPLVDEDWAPRWNYVDEDGRRRTLGKAYRKEPVWTQRFPNKPPDMSNVEYWIRWLSPSDLAGCYELTGPIGRQAFMETDFLQAVQAWAGRVRNDVDYLHNPPETVTRDVLRIDLNGCFPQSWDCHPYGSGICEYLPICTGLSPVPPGGDPAAEDPDRYIYRLPHHTPEVEAAVEAGWLAPGTEGAGGADENEE